MAYKWSWAFGPETPLELETLAGWDIGGGPTDNYPEDTLIHTYLGDGAVRYSLAADNTDKKLPMGIANVRGWVGIYFYFNDPGGFQGNANILTVEGVGQTLNVFTVAPENRLDVRFGTTLSTTGTVSGIPNQTWNHIGLKYDLFAGGTPTVAEWTYELYINGVFSTSGGRTHSSQDESPSPRIWFLGPKNGNPPDNTFFSDIVIYDDLADPNPYGQFVTRTGPTQDLSDSGSWTPASDGGTDAQSANLAGQIATTPVVAEANPLTGEYVRVNTDILGTTLGLDSFNTYGVTGHLFASGSSATNIIAGIGHNPSGPFTTGSAVIDGTNAYAWTSSGSVGLVSGSSFVLNAEISGS